MWMICKHYIYTITEAKAAEAAQSAYYDPNQPQMAYVPPPAYYVSYKITPLISKIFLIFNF